MCWTVTGSGSQYGMRTLDQSLAELLSRGRIEMKAAVALSKNPDSLCGRALQC